MKMKKNIVKSFADGLIGNLNSLTFGLFDDLELIRLSMGHVKHWYSSLKKENKKQYGVKKNA